MAAGSHSMDFDVRRKAMEQSKAGSGMWVCPLVHHGDNRAEMQGCSLDREDDSQMGFRCPQIAPGCLAWSAWVFLDGEVSHLVGLEN